MDNIEWRKESFVQIWNGNTATVTIWLKLHDKIFLKNIFEKTGLVGLCLV